MGENGRATQQDFDIDSFVLSGNPIGQYPTTSGLFLTNSPRIRRIDTSEYYTLAFTNYWLGGTTGSTLSEPYYVEYTYYDDQGLVIRTDQYENIITNGGGPRQDCTQVYQALPILFPPSATTEYNTLYVGAGPANISGFPQNTQYYTVQLFGKFTGTTSPIVPTPTPTPSPKPCNCTQYEIQALTRDVSLTYLNCNESQYNILNVDAGTIDTFCACQDSITILSGFSYILTPQGECNPITPTPSPTPVCSTCTTYQIQYTGENLTTAITITNCENGASQQFIAENSVIYTICSCTFPLTDPDVNVVSQGSCVPVAASPTPTPTLTRTPTPTPSVTTYSYLGRTTPDAADGPTACSTYLTARSYTGLKPLSSLTIGDFLYDTYPSSPTNGGGLWVALKVGGTGPGYAFQVDTNGEILDTYTC